MTEGGGSWDFISFLISEAITPFHTRLNDQGEKISNKTAFSQKKEKGHGHSPDKQSWPQENPQSWS